MFLSYPEEGGWTITNEQRQWAKYIGMKGSYITSKEKCVELVICTTEFARRRTRHLTASNLHVFKCKSIWCPEKSSKVIHESLLLKDKDYIEFLARMSHRMYLLETKTERLQSYALWATRFSSSTEGSLHKHTSFQGSRLLCSAYNSNMKASKNSTPQLYESVCKEIRNNVARNGKASKITQKIHPWIRARL